MAPLRIPIYTKWTFRLKAFRICVTCFRQKLTIWPGKSTFCNNKKKHLKFAYFDVQESRLPDFGRPHTPNGWHQVNFRPTPENSGVWRFNLAMWEVGGIKIERTGAQCFVLAENWSLTDQCFQHKKDVSLESRYEGTKSFTPCPQNIGFWAQKRPNLAQNWHFGTNIGILGQISAFLPHLI